MIAQGVDARLLDALNRASSLELFQLSTVIERLPADPRRTLAIRKDLHLGQTVRFLDWRDGQMRSGKVVALKDTQLVIHEDGSRREWKLPYAAIEPLPATPKPQQPPAPPQHRPTRNDFRCGEKVAFEDRYLQTQVGTIVRINERTATGAQLTNKYAEGYPGKRYYGGCEHVDVVEQLAIERCKQLFGAGFANVQPNSGSQANQGVFFGLLQPGGTIMGMSLAEGGHMTHGMPLNMSGKWFKVVSYGLDANEAIDYDAMERLAHEHKPKLIIAGASAYSLRIDFERFARVAKAVGAYFMVDMAHYAGLIAAGVYPNPVPHADVVTSTTHKSLRGPRGGIVVMNDEAIAKKVNSAIFPGIQGGPLMHVVAGKAVAFHEALQPSFKAYQQQVVANAKVLAETLIERGLRIVSGRTESHVMLVDLRPKGLTGKAAEAVLGQAHITCNKNGIPNDPEKPMVTSGIRLGTPAMTTRGFKEAQARETAHLIADVLDRPDDAANIAAVRAKVAALTRDFPVYR